MSDATYDVIVVGLGGVGSAAAYHLAKSGYRVLGIDRHSPPHRQGSSHGQTRVIRQAYFEHPGYVPLLQTAYRLWNDLEEASGKQLMHRTGLLEIGPPDGVVIPGVLRSAQQFDLEIETMSMQQARQRYPGIHGDESWSVVLERNAGYLKVEDCVATHLELAESLGADVKRNSPVADWTPETNGVTVYCEKASFSAGQLIIACGPWSRGFLGAVKPPLTILRKHIYWYQAPEATYGEASGFPSYFFETPQGYFYGTPVTGDLGLKVARHDGGQPIDAPEKDAHRPDDIDRQLVENFLASHMPHADRKLKHWSGCYYTMSADEHFIIDRLPGCKHVTLVSGLSGHGFKFTSVLGKIAADMATGQDDKLDRSFLALDRFEVGESAVNGG